MHSFFTYLSPSLFTHHRHHYYHYHMTYIRRHFASDLILTRGWKIMSKKLAANCTRRKIESFFEVWSPLFCLNTPPTTRSFFFTFPHLIVHVSIPLFIAHLYLNYYLTNSSARSISLPTNSLAPSKPSRPPVVQPTTPSPPATQPPKNRPAFAGPAFTRITFFSHER